MDGGGNLFTQNGWYRAGHGRECTVPIRLEVSARYQIHLIQSTIHFPAPALTRTHLIVAAVNGKKDTHQYFLFPPFFMYQGTLSREGFVFQVNFFLFVMLFRYVCQEVQVFSSFFPRPQRCVTDHYHLLFLFSSFFYCMQVHCHGRALYFKFFFSFFFYVQESMSDC